MLTPGGVFWPGANLIEEPSEALKGIHAAQLHWVDRLIDNCRLLFKTIHSRIGMLHERQLWVNDNTTLTPNRHFCGCVGAM